MCQGSNGCLKKSCLPLVTAEMDVQSNGEGPGEREGGRKGGEIWRNTKQCDESGIESMNHLL